MDFRKVDCAALLDGPQDKADIVINEVFVTAMEMAEKDASFEDMQKTVMERFYNLPLSAFPPLYEPLLWTLFSEAARQSQTKVTRPESHRVAVK
jgi:hypothetical protein